MEKLDNRTVNLSQSPIVTNYFSRRMVFYIMDIDTFRLGLGLGLGFFFELGEKLIEVNQQCMNIINKIK